MYYPRHSSYSNVRYVLSVLKSLGLTKESAPELCNEVCHYADGLNQSFRALERCGASISSNAYLYYKIIRNAEFAQDCSEAFLVLHAGQANPLMHERLFSEVIHHGDHVKIISRALNDLKNLQFTVQDHFLFYRTVIKNPHLPELPSVFAAIIRFGITENSTPRIHQHFLDHPGRAALALKLLQILYTSGIEAEENSVIYTHIFLNTTYSSQLEQVFEVLLNLGARPKNNLVLYQKIIQKAKLGDQIIVALKALSQCGAHPEHHQALFELMIDHLGDANQLAPLLNIFRLCGFTPNVDSACYELIIVHGAYWESLHEIFKLFDKLGIHAINHRILFETIMTSIHDSYKINGAFQALCLDKTRSDYHAALLSNVLKYKEFADLLIDPFQALHVCGASPEQHFDLYEQVFSLIDHTLPLTQLLNQLHVAQLNAIENPELYRILMSYVGQIEISSFLLCLHRMVKMNVQFPRDLELLPSILSHTPQTIALFEFLEQHHLKFDNHPELYHAYFAGTSPLIHSLYPLSQLNMKILDYFQHRVMHSEFDECDEQGDIQNIISEVLEANHQQITEGPLNKSVSTYAMEAILKRMIHSHIDNTQMFYDDSHGYLLKFDHEPVHYLSHILRFTNFNHLLLSYDEVNAIGEKIEAITNDFFQQEFLEENPMVSRLPISAQFALSCYIGDQRYKNINALFRGIPQTLELNYCWLHPVDATPNLMANFLTGCIINWAAAELPRLLAQSQEHLIWHDSYHQLNRGEDLDENAHVELETLQRRKANPVVLPSVVSFSIFQEGSCYFHKEHTTRTKLETRDSRRPVVNHREGEVLVPSGTTFQYIYNSYQKTFFAREVNSPAILPYGDPWSSVALSESFRKYLSQEYSEEHHEFNGIQRPNHGAAHTFRVIMYIDIVLDYFAHHAHEQNFQKFCQTMPSEERQWLRVAAAFSISGRESEISAQEDPKRYDMYRQQCQTHMEAFIQDYPPTRLDAAMQDRIVHVLRYMGNPDYETHINQIVSVHNQHGDEERLHRNYLHRILSVAHKLDLPRCYGPAEFDAAMMLCRDLSIVSTKQKIDYQRMLRYAIDLIRAHGSSLRTQMSSSGELEVCHQGYAPPFEKISKNLRQLREITDTVSRPHLRESYQFEMFQLSVALED